MTDMTPAGRTFEPGQVWRYNARPIDPGSTFTVLKVEDVEGFGTVVHIAIEDVTIRSPLAPTGFVHRAQHLPMSSAAIDASVTELVRADAPLPDFEEGYRQWRDAKGGVFTVTVGEVVMLIEDALVGAAGGDANRKGSASA